MDYLLEVEQVYAGYVQDLYILQGVNFRIAPGELVTVIGPNGAGKSTLAKTIFGLLKPSAGTITFKEKISLVGNLIKSFPSVWVMFPKLLMFFHP